MVLPTEIFPYLVIVFTVCLPNLLPWGCRPHGECVYPNYLVITNFASISLYLDFYAIAVGTEASIKFYIHKVSLKVKPNGKKDHNFT